MADEKDVKFKLNLDSAEFIEKGLKAKEAIQAIGEAENVAGLIEGLAAVGLALGSVGIAAFAFKEAIDLTLEAEQIKKVEKSFEILSQNAGLSAEHLKTGMEEASAGLIPTNELLKIANESIVKMGSAAEKLPEVMELARKATAVFGGDLTTNFQNITNAIANGNTRMLKHYGILIDSKKAMDDFAKANNLAVNEISAAGRSQAILNAALEKSETAFAGINTDTTTATLTLSALKTNVIEIGETFVLWFDRKMGPSVRNFLTGVKDMSSEVKNYVTSIFGQGMAQTDAQITKTESHLQSLKGYLIDLQTGNEKVGFFSKLFHGDKESQLNQVNAEIEATTNKLEGLRKKNEELASQKKIEDQERASGITKESAQEIADQQIHLANEIKFKAELEKIDQQALSAQMLNVRTFQQIDQNVKAQNLVAEQEHQTKIDEIRKNVNLNTSQRDALLNAQNKLYQEQRMQLEVQNDALRQKMLTNYVNNSNNAFQGVARSFEANSKKMQIEMTHFGKRSQETWDSFAANSTSAFTQMGAAMVQGKNIGEAAAEALKSIFLNMLGDRAVAEGSILMLSSIWPPNPVGLAAGAGLMTLGGALKALAGGAGGGSSPPAVSATAGGGGVSGGATSYGPISGNQDASQSSSASSASQTNMDQMQAHQRVVNVNIAGNYMETDSTRRQLMEMMRQETDATSFTYNQIGV
jgi:hypothetical protein